MMLLIGIDGSLTATGVVVLELHGDAWRMREDFLVKTEPDNKSRHIYKADDDGARVDAISVAIEGAIGRSPAPRFVALEAPAGSQSATGAKGLALAYATIRTTLRMLGVTPIMVQAHHAKKAATGNANATKEQVIAAMQARYVWPERKRTKPAAEAIADALAVATAALDEPAVKSRIEEARGAGREHAA